MLPKCIASFSFSGVILVLFSNFNGVDSFKGYFQLSLLSIYQFMPIYQKRCMLWPIFICSTYTKSYMIIQFTLWPLTLDDINRSNQCQIIFKWLYLINNSSYEQRLLKIHVHITNHTWPFSVPSVDTCLLETHIGSHIWLISLLQHLLPCSVL